MNVFILAILATIFYAAFQIFSAKAGGKIDGILVAGLVNLFGLVVPLSVYFYIKYISKNEQLSTTKNGLIMAGLAGVSISLFAMAFHKMFQGGANLSLVSPIVFGAAIGLSVIYSSFFLGEILSSFHIFGIILIITGIGLIVYARANA